MKSFMLIDIAERFIKEYGNKKTRIRFIGLRPGERLHEFSGENISSAYQISTDLDYIFQNNV